MQDRKHYFCPRQDLLVCGCTKGSSCEPLPACGHIKRVISAHSQSRVLSNKVPNHLFVMTENLQAMWLDWSTDSSGPAGCLQPAPQYFSDTHSNPPLTFYHLPFLTAKNMYWMEWPPRYLSVTLGCWCYHIRVDQYALNSIVLHIYDVKNII